jgi:hypothetical protein
MELLQLINGKVVPTKVVIMVAPGTQMHWIAYCEYSDGMTRETNNANGSASLRHVDQLRSGSD